jgi:hypothetical protein
LLFNTFLPVWPVVSDPPAKTPKARELVAHVLRDTRIGEQAQAARQARRAAAGFNKGAAANSHRPFSFDRDMKFEHHHSIAGLAARWLCLSSRR